MLWGRKIEIEFFDADNESDNLVIPGINELRITVQYTETLGFGADSAEISIYNLSPQSIEALRASYKKLGIRVYAGYAGTVYTQNVYDKNSMVEAERAGDTSPFSLLFIGTVNTMYGRKAYTEHITKLFCIPKASDWGAKVVRTRTKGMTVKQAVEDLAAKAGWFNADGTSLVRFNAIAEDVLNMKLGSLTFEGSLVFCLDKIMTQTNLIYKLTPSGIDVYEQSKSAVGNTHDESYENRLAKSDPSNVLKPFLDDVKQTPERSLSGLTVRLQMDAKYHPGRIMDVVDLLSVGSSVDNENNRSRSVQPFNNGIINYDSGRDLLFRNDIYVNFLDFRYYFITAVTHDLDTHGPNWDTTVEGMVTNYNYSDPSTGVYYNVHPQGGNF